VTDPFQVLGLPAKFDLTPASIERAYLTRIALLHPDLGEVDERAAAALNDAKAELLDEERRAEALLAKLKGPGKSEDKSLPPGFLMEMMEIRETLESDLQSSPSEARVRWSAWVADRKAEHRAALTTMFAATPPPLGEIRKTLNQWRYVERLAEELVEKAE
jgi:molecular chaperone HscB